MKIAVPTNDGFSISAHFGRSAAFLVFEVEGGQIRSCETRPNSGCHSHAAGSCSIGGAAAGTDNHAGIAGVLAGCDVVLCGGMGGGAAAALKAGGIPSIVVSATGSAEAAVSAYVTGALTPSRAPSCHCSH